MLHFKSWTFCLQEAWSPGTEVVSMYNFQGNSAEDLPFKRGEVMTIVRATKVFTLKNVLIFIIEI